MKIFAFLIVALCCAQASALNITAVSGSSNEVNLNGKNAPVFMAGIAGSSRCEAVPTTINTCSNNPERAACNFRTVCPSSLLHITFTAKVSGKVSLMDISSYPIYPLGNYTAGTTHTVSIPWKEICNGLASDPTCQVISRGVLRLGIDSTGNYQPEEYGSYIFQVSGMTDNRWDFKNDKMESISTKEGIRDYKMIAGNGKAFVNSVEFHSVYLGEAARIKGVRVFHAPASCAQLSSQANAVNTSHDSHQLMLDESQTTLLANEISGLQNNVKYAFMMGLQDEAGNIGYFKDLNEQCVEGQHTATPKAL